jgi:hypothetical protein
MMATVAAVTEFVESLPMTELLDRIQLEQFRHDELYHREISRLPTQVRLKHMALHFAKYAGNLAESGRDDPAVFKRIVTDVFIIATSTANALNARLADELPNSPGDSSFDVDPLTAMSKALTVNAGRMAAACEKLDHLEDFPFRPVIKGAAVDLLKASLEVCRTQSWVIHDLVAARLQPIKEKSIFYGKL